MTSEVFQSDYYFKSVRVWSFSGLNFVVFGLNMEIFRASLPWWPPVLENLESLENRLNFFLSLKSPLKTLKFWGFLSDLGKHKCQLLKPLKSNQFSSVFIFQFSQSPCKTSFCIIFQELDNCCLIRGQIDVCFLPCLI